MKIFRKSITGTLLCKLVCHFLQKRGLFSKRTKSTKKCCLHFGAWNVEINKN